MRWPFFDPPNVAVFTTKEVMNGSSPILQVFHDVEDGAWQFLGKSGADTEQSMVVALSEIYRIDSTIGEIANLPLGKTAYRTGIDEAWKYEMS